jgi:hypothetical protein
MKTGEANDLMLRPDSNCKQSGDPSPHSKAGNYSKIVRVILSTQQNTREIDI